MKAAPAALCHLADLDVTGAKGVTAGAGAGGGSIVVVRHGDAVVAYENRCPHLHMPLEIVPDRFLDETGENLVCRTHGARFSVRDGYCISGPCRGAWLRPVRVALVDGVVRLAADETD